ncbi:MAG: hypothetical protein ACQERD_06810 [Campylobacterota bacterium]
MGAFTRLIKGFFKKFIKLSRPLFSFDENELRFKVDLETVFAYPLDNFETNTRHDSYILEAYTIVNKHLLVEYVNIDSDVTWNGLPSSLYITLLKNKENIKYMSILEKHEFDGFDFIVYEVDKKYILNFIYIYEINKDVFIVDTSGDLFARLLEQFDFSYEYKYDKAQMVTLKGNFSIVRENAIYSYFTLSD